MERSATPGKSRHRQIKTAPEEMDRTYLAKIASPKALQDSVSLDQRQEEA
jgi:hypothetical protein